MMTKPQLTVLIVDDSPEDRELVCRALRRDPDVDYLTMEASSGAQGLTLCQTTPPMCVVLDYRLPDYDGLEFLQALKGESETLPCAVVLVTGMGNETVAVQALKSGAQDYLVKGDLSPLRLRHAVRSAIEKVALERRLADAHTELERRVEMRTAELARANAELQVAIAEQKQAQEAIRTLNAELDQRIEARTAELRRVNADLRRVAYISAHDLQEPARIVVLYAQLLAKRYQGALDAQADTYLGYAIEGARRMLAQLNALLDYVQVEIEPKPFVLTDCEVAFSHAQQVLEQNITGCSAVITQDPLPVVSATSAQLQLVFQHLLDNALKFRNSAPPHIHVWAERENQVWKFAVRDNGIGIDPTCTDQIFELFKRLHPRDKYPGTGLGLAICKKIVERHGGRIWTESQPGAGSTFFFTLNGPNT
jgi:two-component system, sensor histidine kinase and response regulator